MSPTRSSHNLNPKNTQPLMTMMQNHPAQLRLGKDRSRTDITGTWHLPAADAVDLRAVAMYRGWPGQPAAGNNCHLPTFRRRQSIMAALSGATRSAGREWKSPGPGAPEADSLHSKTPGRGCVIIHQQHMGGPKASHFLQNDPPLLNPKQAGATVAAEPGYDSGTSCMQVSFLSLV